MPKQKVKSLKKCFSDVTQTLETIDILRLRLIGKKILILDQIEMLSNTKPVRSDIISQET